MSPLLDLPSVVKGKDDAASDLPKELGEKGKFEARIDGGADRDPSDAALLSVLAGGDEAAFWRLWNRYRVGLGRICRRKMGGNLADAEDVLSQVMLKALDRLPAYGGRIVCLEAWLHQLARNMCVDLWRERRQRLETAENWKAVVLADAGSGQRISLDEVAKEIQERIAALPASLREPLVLHLVREIPSKEVASQLGLSPANVRKRVQSACAWLRSEMANGRAGNYETGTAKTHPSLPALAIRAPRRSEPWGHFPSAGIICTVNVRLPCGVEQLFHVFPAHAPFGQGRKLNSLHGFLQDHPGSWRKHLELAELHYLTGNWAEAVVEWQRVLEKRLLLSVTLALGDTLLKLGEFEGAANVFDSARGACPQSAAIERHLDGWIAFCRRDAGRSVAEFQTAAELEPGNPVHFHGLALAHRLAGALPAALTAIEGALQLNRNDLFALSHGHELLVAAGELNEAIRRAQRILELWPQDLLTGRRLVDCRCRLGLTRGEAGNETKLQLRRLSRHSRNPFLIREPLSAFFVSHGEPAKALAVHRRFVEEHSHCPLGYEGYSRLQALSKMGDELPAPPRSLNLAVRHRCNGACNWCGESDRLG
jgi:RNA polymerase sigma-70 factor (ECF subfamily)